MNYFGFPRRKTYVAVFSVILLTVSLAAAQNAGFDYFQTGAGASVDLSSIGLGVVQLQGVPIQSATGNADTIMYRPQNVPSGGGTIPVNVYALFMKSQSSVTFNGQQADVYITLNNSNGAIPTTVLPQPDPLAPSTGTITVYPSTSTFDSSITVNADVILVTTGASPANSAAVLGHQPASPITLSQTGSSYLPSPPSGYPAWVPPNSPLASSIPQKFACPDPCPGGGGPPPPGFFPKPVHTGPHPVILAGPAPAPTPTPTPTPSPTPAPPPSGGCAKAGPNGAATGNNAPSGKAVTCLSCCASTR